MIDTQQADLIADALAGSGFIVLPQALPARICEPLLTRITHDQKHFKAASVGRGEGSVRDTSIRGDHILWLTTSNPADGAYLSWMEDLRLALNQRLFLGLFDYESHFSVYRRGAFYRRHFDAFQGDSNRVLSTVFYLNDCWKSADGGQLLLYPGNGVAPVEVLPRFATMVVFLSREIAHEVLPANRTRYSIAGWFRVNASSSRLINPIL